MIFAAPLALIGLVSLPLIWWLIRATPPAPRDVPHPALLLLRRLAHRRKDAARAPLWLLLLRLTAIALVVLGLAQPTRLSRADLPVSAGSGTLTLVLDDGWASIGTWRSRQNTARALVTQAARAGRPVALLRTARLPDGTMPEPLVTQDTATALRTLTQWRPEPWGPDRAGLAAQLRDLITHDRLGSAPALVLLSDGVASLGDDALRASLPPFASIEDMRWDDCALATLGAHTGQSLHAIVHTMPHCPQRTVLIRARTQEGATLLTQSSIMAPDATRTDIALDLAPMLRNRTASLTLDGTDGPAGVRLLDAGDRRHPVGLIASRGADTPLIGALFFLRRALDPIAELHEGDVHSLVHSPLSVLIATDGTLANDTARQAVAQWVAKGGELIRFAGPDMAATNTETNTVHPDSAQTLLPVSLMGMRQIGGAMSWGKPQPPMPFAETSPFAGLPLPPEVTISRQVLAQPSADLDAHVWARLADGTPLVTATRLGAGEIVLFHVTPGADWSTLPLSGLFPDLLHRLIDRSAGQRGAAATGPLQPALSLETDGLLGPAPSAARAISATTFDQTPVSQMHPAGLYGPQTARRALNLGDAPRGFGPDADTAALMPEPAFGPLLPQTNTRPERPFGPAIALIGFLFLLGDLIATLRLRGLLRPRGLALVLAFSLAAVQAHAQDVPKAAIEPHLGYILSGDQSVDDISRQGLQGLSAYVSARTSAQLGPPDGVVPGRDDLSAFPVLYWPITPQTHTGPAAITALNEYMAHGGILLIDTQGAGSDLDDAGQSAATQAALRHATEGLDVPALTKLSSDHVLARTFYLLRDFPGRLAGQPVWVARSGDEANDDVSPVIIGSGDWARAWAVDETGAHPYATIPGGDDQRTMADRFGVNVVMYALTGNYKADQVHIPAILKRLGGQSAAAGDDR